MCTSLPVTQQDEMYASHGSLGADTVDMHTHQSTRGYFRPKDAQLLYLVRISCSVPTVRAAHQETRPA